MQNIALSIILVFFLSGMLCGQTEFPYQVSLEAYEIPDMEGIHSYAYGQWKGKWVFIGGRLDGLHPRQPFRSFAASANNTRIRVVDPQSKEIWMAAIDTLPVDLREQLQATNMQFFQEGPELFIAGGYAYSKSKEDHITFPALTIVNLEGLLDSVMLGKGLNSNFQQIREDDLAVTGGHLGKMGDTLYLVGGHRFDGRYNPMGHATYTQTYTNAIRKIPLKKSDGQWSLEPISEVYDPVHLHRRDYNLLPQIFPDGRFGYTIFSGVFQINEDLPFLYPVDVTAENYQPNTGFNQYLSNYHSASVAMYDTQSNSMHNLFFGGISQYYFEADSLIRDKNVPFVKTISRLSRDKNGRLEEVRLPLEMPSFLGASAEFLPNEDLPTVGPEIIDLSGVDADSFLLGYIVGGIKSNVLHAFSFNNTEATVASTTIYKVYLEKKELSTAKNIALPGYHAFEIETFPHKDHADKFSLVADMPEKGMLEIFVTDASGRLVMNQRKFGLLKGENTLELQLKRPLSGPAYITAILNGRYAARSEVVFD